MNIVQALLGSILAIPFYIVAEATEPPNLFFSCTTKSQKKVELFKYEKTLTYSFGRTDHPPELYISSPSNEVIASIGNTSGSELNNSLTFTNGAYNYIVTSSVNRTGEIQEPEHGVIVKNRSKYLAYIPCIPESVQGSLLDFE